MGRPSLGSWVTYGLGSVADNLPAFPSSVNDGPLKPGPGVWGNGFLPAAVSRRQPAPGRRADSQSPSRPAGVSDRAQPRHVLDYTQWAPTPATARAREDDADLDARIASYELAFRRHAAPRPRGRG